MTDSTRETSWVEGLRGTPGFLFFLITGMAPRLLLFFHNRSMWNDEVGLALNLIERSAAGLLEPLDYGQAAPVGFLLVSKGLVSLFGAHDMVFRLQPLLYGLLSLPLFWLLARRVCGRFVWPCSMLFALSEFAQYYSVEFKPYAADVFFQILILHGLFRILDRKKGITSANGLALALAGGVAAWFSFAVIFQLAASGLILLLCTWLYSPQEEKRARLARVFGIGVCWLLSFSVHYFCFAIHSRHPGFLEYWGKNFAPIPPVSPQDLVWYVKAVAGLLHIPLGFEGVVRILPLAVLVTGGVAAVRKEPVRALHLVSPLVLCLIASALHAYPFSRRMLLFALPGLILFLYVALSVLPWQRPRWSTLALSIALLVPGSWQTLRMFLVEAERAKIEIRPLVQILRREKSVDDDLYVYYGAEIPFRYYTYDRPIPYLGVFGQPERTRQIITGAGEWNRYHAEPERMLEPLAGADSERLWVLFSHVRRDDYDEEEWLRKHLDEMGELLRAYHEPAASLYLYRMMKPPGSQTQESLDRPR